MGAGAPEGVPGVIFDLDGVLLDSEDLYYRAYSEVLAPYGVAVDRPTYAREWIAAGRGAEYAHETLGVPLPPAEIRRLKDPVLLRLLLDEARLMPGAAEALARLAAEFPLALATNSKERIVDLILDRFGLRDHFTALVPRERYAASKPAPDAFLAAAAALGRPPARCLVVEDSEKGVLAAHRAGCPCVAVPHAFTQDSDFSLARAVVPSLDALTPDFVRETVAAAP